MRIILEIEYSDSTTDAGKLATEISDQLFETLVDRVTDLSVATTVVE